MSLFPKIIDVSQGYFPCDPNSFPENLHYTAQEDSPVKTSPVLLYDGWNILPTAYGYRSYFGLTSKINVAELTSRCDGLLVFQTSTYANKIYAMCEDGLWTLSAGTWTHSYTLSIPTAGTHLEWTWCIIENTLYMYRQANTVVYKVIADGTLSSFTPSFLTMAGQMGIFRANGRLGFWDSANSVSWSSLFDHSDFTPSLNTLAGNRIFNAVIGRIVVIRSKSDGFVIYCTRRIVGVRYMTTGTLLWDADAITDDIGIAYPKQSTTGVTDNDQYFYGGGALYAIGQYNQVSKSTQLVPVFPEVTDFLRETRDPVFLEFFGGRYLYLYLINNRYIDGMVHFESHTVPTLNLTLFEGWDGTVLDMPALVINSEINQALGQLFDGGSAEQQTCNPGTGVHPIWSCVVPRCDGKYNGLFSLNYGTWGVAQASMLGALDINVSAGFPLEGEWISSASLKPLITGTVEGTDGNNHTYTSTGKSTGYSAVIDNVLKLINVFVSQYEEMQERVRLEVARIGTYKQHLTTNLGTASIGGTDIGPTSTSGTGGSNYIYQIAYFSSSNVFSLSDYYTGSGPITVLTRPGRITLRKHLQTYITITTYHQRLYLYADNTYNICKMVPSPFLNVVIPTTESSYDTLDAGISWALADRTFLNTTSSPVVSGEPNFNFYIKNGRVIGNTFVVHDTFKEYINPDSYPGYEGRYGLQPHSVGNWVFKPSFDIVDVIPFPTVEHRNIDYYTVFYNVCMAAKQDAVFTMTDWLTITGTVVGAVSVYAGAAEANENICDARYEFRMKNPSIGVTVYQAPTGVKLPYYDSGLDYPDYYLEFPTLGGVSYPPYTLDLPGATFLLQDGSIGPIYPTYVGALVYDVALKKWGKFKGQFKQLIEYSPCNKIDEGIITHDNFGMDVGVLDTSGYLRLFDLNPTDSLAKWGKIGYYRAGFTRASEVIIHFRLPSTCTVKLEHSLDGRSINSDLTKETSVTSALSVTFGLDVVGVWFNIVLAGQFDVQYIEFRAYPQGIR